MLHRTRWIHGIAGIAATLLVTTVPLSSQVLRGRWDARIRYDTLAIEFAMEWKGSGRTLSLSFFNGATPLSSTSVVRKGDSVVAEFSQLGTAFRGVLRDGGLVGTYGPPNRTNPIVEARPATARTAVARGPNINGEWYLPTRSAKGEDAWRLIVGQKGAEVTATILRIDGDAGALVGTWRDSIFTLHHFDGTRPARLTIRPQPDGTLAVTFTTGPRGASAQYTALRPDSARARSLPEPADFATHTSVRDPGDPFRFSFPDLGGTLVSNTDPRFRDRVVVITIGGSWCPNCHDEAPFLAALHRKYRERGLEVVSLDFEEKEQLADLARVKAFASKYQLEYPILIAGQPSEVREKLPQAVNLNTWPATFFLGRDGTVRAVRAGFAGPASGEFHKRLEKDYTGIIEGLLREAAPSRGPQ